MKRSWYRVLLAVLLPLTVLTGCWDYRRLDARAFALAIALDSGDDGQLEVTGQFPRPGALKGGGGGGGGGSSQGEEAFFMVTGRGGTFTEALTDMQNMLSRQASFGHLRSVVVGEKLARQGIRPMFFELMRFPEVDKTADFMVALSAKGADVLRAKPPQEKLPAIYLSRAFLTIRARNFTVPSRIVDFYVNSSNPGLSPFMTSLSLSSSKVPKPPEGAGPQGGGGGGGKGKDTEPDQISFKGMALFSDYKMVEKLEAEEAQGLLWVKGARNQTLTLTRGGPGGDYDAIRNLWTKSTMFARLENGGLVLSYEVNGEGDVEQSRQRAIRVTDKDFRELEKQASARITADATKSLKKLQASRTDILGTGAEIRARYRGLWVELTRDRAWEDVFSGARIEVKASVKLRRKGIIS